ncbi:carboxypeptidase-like regulatory domain-containing protein [Robiginitalea sp. SC105]|uniref:carboxypeptidase-like regulatory domain-containing protein n=1 Tax=Robiginitalea sp. SC105 TaxID=2762332 RepID=UPI001639D5BC|nr:carboxypeptidase-like regulatory domain-containing protein [Robiginitalea sp. SC105]MBC2838126.1 carboxypeptidase-like regulatory domain-containing protein [Robiginitalea sp. SC105]
MSRRAGILYIFTIFLMLTASGLFAQETGYFRGRLTDRETGEPVVFATVRIAGLNKGVISNADGDFRIPYRLLPANAVLEISSMGYESLRLDVYRYTEGHILPIRMRSRVFALTEAVVSADRKRLSARAIVRRAIRAIPRNYPQEPYSLIGYYRDYQRDSVGYLNLNEAILEVFDLGFGQTDSATTRELVYALEENRDFRRDTLALQAYDYITRRKVIRRAYLAGYGGNEFRILRVHDPIRNYRINSFDFVNVLEDDFLSHHSFHLEDPVYLGDKLLYRINFVRRDPGYLASGNIYISRGNFAIHKLEYTIHTNLRDPEGGARSWKPQDFRDLVFNLSLEYREQEGQMFLNYISFRNTFEVALPPEFKLVETVVDLDCRCIVVTFNVPPDLASIQRPRAFNFRYKGKPLKFKEIIRKKESVYLIPALQELALDELLRTMRAADILDNPKIGEPRDLMEFELGKLVDFRGNLLGYQERRPYVQFREFFTQQLHVGRRSPANAAFANPDRPLFMSAVQASNRPVSDYWLNTPLQTMAIPKTQVPK